MQDIMINPIIPIWAMAIICVALLCLKRRGVIPYIRQIVIVILLFLINLRPMIPDKNIKVTQDKFQCKVVFVVDDTISMLAEDYDGKNPRFNGAKADMAYIVDELEGAQFCVIDFNNNAQVLTPFTDNPEFVKAVIDSIYPLDYLYAFGTNLSVTKDVLEDVLENTEDDDMPVYVFFISDGEITDDYALKSFDELAEYIDGGAVMGYGTKKGGVMHYYDSYYEEYKTLMDERDYPYEPAVSCIDEDNLETIADDLGIKYVHMDRQSRIDSTLNKIKNGTDIDTEENTKSGYTDIYYFFVIPLSILIAYEFISVKRRG